MSAPCSPGDVIRVRERRSAATVTRAPRSLASAITAVWSNTRPETPGCCRTTPLMTPSGRPLERSATSTSKPRASARPLTIAMVCGQAVGVEDGLAVVRRLVLIRAAHHQHGLGHGGGFIQQGGVGDRQADEVLDHGLEVQQRLQPALGDLRLVGRVRGVPGRGFEDVAADHRRGERVVVALPDHLHGGLVLRRQLAQLGEDFDFAQGRGEREVGVLADVLRNGGVHQGVDGVVADSLQHGVDVGLAARADMPVNEGRGGWGNSHKELHNSGGAGYATLIRVPPRSVLDLRVSAQPAFQGSACTVGEHSMSGTRLLLSRDALPRRYMGLRDSWGGFAPTAPACTYLQDSPAADQRRI